jgi:hypothetical protein
MLAYAMYREAAGAGATAAKEEGVGGVVSAVEVVGLVGGGKPQVEGTEVKPEGGAAFGVSVKAEEEKMCVSSVLQSMTNAGMSVSAQLMFGSLEVHTHAHTLMPTLTRMLCECSADVRKPRGTFQAF